MTATLRFDVVSNGSAARRDLAATRGEVDRFGRSTTSLGATTSRNESKVKRFGAAIGSVAKVAGPLALLGAGAAVAKFGRDSVEAASRTQQAWGALDSVFKRNADTVKRWANDAADDVGLARSEYAELASVLGASLKNSGIDDFANKTRDLVGLGADLAATFGGKTSDAVSALGSLLRGETDPIERFGVSIKAVDVTARLAANGQDKLTGAAKRSAEQQARLDLLFEQTTDAQGAFAREAGTAAGAQQRLTAKWTNAKDRLGQHLLPALAKTTDFLSDTLDGSNKFGRGLRKLGDIISTYASPIINAIRRNIDKVQAAFKRADSDGEGLTDAIRALVKIGEKIAPILGRNASRVIDALGDGLAFAAGQADMLASALQRVIDWAQKANDKLGGLPGNALRLATTGLFRSAPEGRLGGLTRDSGVGYVSAPTPAPIVNLKSSPSVVIDVDSPALARLFRVIVRDELSRLGSGGGSVIA